MTHGAVYFNIANDCKKSLLLHHKFSEVLWETVFMKLRGAVHCLIHPDFYQFEEKILNSIGKMESSFCLSPLIKELSD